MCPLMSELPSMALAGLGAAGCLGLTARCLWAGNQAEQGRCIVAHNHVQQWHRDNIHLFAPPICNKIMHKDDLTVMCVWQEALPLPVPRGAESSQAAVRARRFIGGPNTREDYHLDLGSEFFFQMKGNMELPTIQQGRRKLVKINQGQVFLLPSRIPHSPQRQADTFGLVVERKRDQDEVDGLRWYTSFEQPDTSTDGSTPKGVLWDRFFYCGDLEKDLVPVVKAYKSSAECSDVRTVAPCHSVACLSQ